MLVTALQKDREQMFQNGLREGEQKGLREGRKVELKRQRRCLPREWR